MKKYYFLFFFFLIIDNLHAQDCTLSNGTACQCLDGGDECDLLPDMVIAESLLLDPSENVEIRGELRISVSTPNIGYGPLEVAATNQFICGTDTIISQINNWQGCPNGEEPRQIIEQKVYQKVGNDIQNYLRTAGLMAFHPTHGHMHVDDWVTFSIRQKMDDLHPLNWPIVVKGRKIGFCLRDSGSCGFFNGYCTNENGETLVNDDLPNFKLGGGVYTCGFLQGISVGYTDTYGYFLDDMDIQIPNTICNGAYHLVVQVDPLNHFLEQNENNNWVSIPINLSKQNIQPEELLILTGSTNICTGDTAILQAQYGTAFDWSTGDTTQSIAVTESGLYHVTVQTPCGVLTSESVAITVENVSIQSVENDTVTCQPASATLQANSDDSGVFYWYDALDATEPISEGAVFETPVIENTHFFYVTQEKIVEGEIHFSPPHDNTIGMSSISNPSFNGYQIFDCHVPFTLQSVKVYAEGAGKRIIQLRDSMGVVLQEKMIEIPDGESRVILNFEVEIGKNYQLAAAEFPFLERTNSDVTYPYGIDKLLTIKASSLDDPVAGFFYYYYFYDWEVKERDLICSSPRQAVVAYYQNCVDIQDVFVNQQITIQPNPNQGVIQLLFSLQQPQTIELKIVDLHGKIIYQQDLGLVTHTFNETIQWWNKGKPHYGIYLVEIQTSAGSYYEKMLVYK